MQCPQCGTSLSEATRFCSNCGRRFAAKAEGNTKVKRIASERRPASPTLLPPTAPPDDSPSVDRLDDVAAAETHEWSLTPEVPPHAAWATVSTTLAVGTILAERYVIQAVAVSDNGDPLYTVADTVTMPPCWECDAPPQADERFCSECGAEQRGGTFTVQQTTVPDLDDATVILDTTPQGTRYFRIITHTDLLDTAVTTTLSAETATLSSIRTMEMPIAPHDEKPSAPTAIDLESTLALDRFTITDPDDSIEVPPEVLLRISSMGMIDPSATVAPEVWEQNEAPTLEVHFVEQLGQVQRGIEIPADYPILITGIASNVGQARVGRPNEDSALVTTLTFAGDTVPPPLTLCVIADGLGGHNDGQRAGRIAVRVIARHIINHLWLPMLADSTPTPAEPQVLATALTDAIQEANTMILVLNQEEGGDMGCTVTALVAQGMAACIANVGDSRTYRLTADGLRRVTTDHSLVARLVKSRMIEPEEVYTHPQRSQIYRSLGDETRVEVDIFPSQLEPGERFLLCSDGLWEMVRDPDIAMVLGADATPQQVADHLIHTANANGGDDNITVITVEVVQP